MQKKLIALLVFFFFITLTSRSISAIENQNQGKINIYLEESNNATNLSGVEFKLVKVATLTNGTYNYIEELEHLNLHDLNTLNTADALNKASNDISNFVTQKNISGIIKKTNNYGYTQFNNLEEGVYLLQAININEYDNISPTLIALPTFDNSDKTNGMNYEVNIIPKHTPIIAVKTDDNSIIVIPLTLAVITGSVIYSLIKELKMQ